MTSDTASQRFPEEQRDLVRRAQNRELVLHEMGHYVIARALGFPTGKVFFENDGVSRRGVAKILSEEIDGFAKARDYFDRRVVMLLAATVAETLSQEAEGLRCDLAAAIEKIERRHHNARLENAFISTDIAKVEELLKLSADCSHPGTKIIDGEQSNTLFDQIQSRAFYETARLVDENAEIIMGLSQILLQRLQDEERASFEAAEIENIELVRMIRPATLSIRAEP